MKLEEKTDLSSTKCIMCGCTELSPCHKCPNENITFWSCPKAASSHHKNSECVICHGCYEKEKDKACKNLAKERYAKVEEKEDLEGRHLMEGTGKEKFPLAETWQKLMEPMILFNQLSGEDSVCFALP